MAPGLLHLLVEIGGRQPQSAVAQNNQLLRPVRGGHLYPVLFPDLIGGLFDIGVRRLRLPGINHMDVVIVLHRSQTALYLIRVKHHDHPALPVTLVVAQQVAKMLPGRVQVILRDLLQLVPGENDVIAVHQQIFRSPVLLPDDSGAGRLRRRAADLPGWKKRPPLYRAVGPLENSLQLLILLHGPGVTGAAPGRRGLPGLRPGLLKPQSAVHMGAGGHLVPPHCVSPAVGAEHRVRCVLHIPLRVIANGGDYRGGVRAGAVSPQRAQQPSLPPGVSGHLPGVVPHGGHGGGTGEHSLLTHRLRRRDLPFHSLKVTDGPARLGGGQLQTEIVPGLQQHALRPHQSLAHRPVGGLAEVSALGVLFVGPARHQRQPHIRDGRARQHARVLPLRQVRQNQPLPVTVQQILRAGRSQNQPAARLARLQQQMHLRIVPQGLKVADALHRGGNGLPVADGPGPKGYRHSKPLLQDAL